MEGVAFQFSGWVFLALFFLNLSVATLVSTIRGECLLPWSGLRLAWNLEAVPEGFTVD